MRWSPKPTFLRSDRKNVQGSISLQGWAVELFTL